MYRLLPVECVPFIYGGTTFVLSMLITTAASQPKNLQAQSVDPVWWKVVLPTSSFEPPGDKSPDRTSGLGSRSHRRHGAQGQIV